MRTICEGGRRITDQHRECGSCWDGLLAILGLVGLQVSEMLPSGEGEARVLTGNGKASRPRLIPDHSRLAFLNALPVAVIQKIEAVKGSYQAFVFRTTSGKMIAVVEALRTENALYVLDANQPTWLEAARSDKGAVRQRPEFVSRIVHTGSWQTRVRKLLELS